MNDIDTLTSILLEKIDDWQLRTGKIMQVDIRDFPNEIRAEFRYAEAVKTIIVTKRAPSSNG